MHLTFQLVTLFSFLSACACIIYTTLEISPAHTYKPLSLFSIFQDACVVNKETIEQ